MLAGKLTVSAALVAAVAADIYMHNPRGSNNRLDEARRDRNNANRMFDSQNNNRGGSNVGSLYFYEGEKVPMEWTNQHGCGSTQNTCEMVVQYMCDDRLRDGVTTRTIPQTPSQCLNNDCNTDTRYGMHEDYDYYMNCNFRFRNRGLFIADRNLNGNTARFTRQNNDGDRSGYECPEERDHYPYWHPSPWVDLAITTNDPSKCTWYQSESENVKGRNFCSLPDMWYHQMVSQGGNGNNGFIPNTMALCNALNLAASPMMTFLTAQASTYTRQMNARAAVELSACNAKMMEFATLCPLVEDPSNCTASVAFFNNANNFITATQLDQQCPVCNATDSLHPFSVCPMCGPSSCAASSMFAMTVANVSVSNGTTTNTTVCPAGFVRDMSSAWCIASQCATNFTVLSATQQRMNDDCKSGLVGVGATAKIVVTGTNVSNYVCFSRNSSTALCIAASTPARWTLKAPHNARILGLAPPACTASQWSRANHLGNGIGGETNGWNLTVPSHIAERCAIRLRYNITTMDYGILDPHNSSQVNSTQNKNAGNNPAKINIGASFDIATTAATMPYENARGYLWRDNPRVTIFDLTMMVRYCPNGPSENAVGMNDQNGFPTMCRTGNALTTASSAFCPAGTVAVNPQAPNTFANPCGAATNGLFCVDGNGVVTAGFGCASGTARALNNAGLRNQDDTPNGDKDFRLQLAINTNQFGRTFQDRTHSHAFRALTPELRQTCTSIHALNVRGKRGNVVQTFPGTEYDFVPNTLVVHRGDCVHFQWTGSNTNPDNNDGQGKQGTDRSNIALQENVRGEGGRGVLRFGGAGAAGTTWTTKDMEPGYEGFRANVVPSMFDVQCDSGANANRMMRPFNVPFPAWRLCSNCNATHFRGTLTNVTTACPVGFTYQECRMCDGVCCAGTSGICHRTTENCTFSDRPSNPVVFTGVGLDARDMSFAGFDSQQIGAKDDVKFGAWGHSHPEHLNNVTAWNVWGMTYTNFINLATLNNVQFRGEMSELDDAGTYFDLPPQTIGGPTGSFYYLCTRNNNFSNRSQKGKIIVTDAVAANVACSVAGCSVGVSSGPMLGASGSGNALTGGAKTEGAATVSVPPMSIQTRESINVAMVSGSGLSDASSDVVMVSPSNLRATPSFMSFQLTVPATGGRRQNNNNPMSGIWVSVVQADQGSNKLYIELKSPDSGVIAASRIAIWEWLVQYGLQAWEPWMCVELSFGDQTWAVQLGISPSNVLQYELTIPEAQRAAVNAALWGGSLRIQAGFPTMMDVNASAVNVSAMMRTCSANPFTGTIPIDPASGKPITLSIPVAAAFAYGAIYRWPVNNRTTACFIQGIGCDSVYTDDSRETITDASCAGGVCSMERVQAGGYYQVSSANTMALVIGISFGVVVFSALLVGGALYFRRNPEKWEAAKSWGPSKYKALGRSLQSRV